MGSKTQATMRIEALRTTFRKASEVLGLHRRANRHTDLYDVDGVDGALRRINQATRENDSSVVSIDFTEDEIEALWSACTHAAFEYEPRSSVRDVRFSRLEIALVEAGTNEPEQVGATDADVAFAIDELERQESEQ